MMSLLISQFGWIHGWKSCCAILELSSRHKRDKHQLSFPLKTRNRKKSEGNNTIAPATKA